ncbi:transporter substrate-binding domain-containing protein [Marinobacter sp. CHS3-4]|uniref:substrate-binding periplasmic protein n=1 Tax=Marinobacter sp. CHS3-4 TaxID=3045174 RepID=UPI0024B4F6DD|nr:transporter substrate-binding domain-containing protein [Marinobacter sp. CHS3-4]MDI9244177.1 transporter substrate-binding domain-containing protein [Marinobacter sp. CHS3-4]
MKPYALSFTLVTCLLTTVVQADTITIRADSWYPMNGDPGSEKPGYMIELARAVFEPAGHEVDYGVMPWERAVRSVRSGEFDCVVGAYKEDAPDFIFPEESWGHDETHLWVTPSNDWRYNGVQSLDGVTVGMIGGYAYAGDFDAYFEANPEQAQFVYANNALEQNIKKVVGGRIDATAESPSVMRAKLKDMGMQGKLTSAGALAEAVPMYIACSPANDRSKAYADLVDSGTRELRKSGKMKALLDRYGLEDWK